MFSPVFVGFDIVVPCLGNLYGPVLPRRVLTAAAVCCVRPSLSLSNLVVVVVVVVEARPPLRDFFRKVSSCLVC